MPCCWNILIFILLQSPLSPIAPLVPILTFLFQIPLHIHLHIPPCFPRKIPSQINVPCITPQVSHNSSSSSPFSLTSCWLFFLIASVIRRRELCTEYLSVYMAGLVALHVWFCATTYFFVFFCRGITLALRYYSPFINIYEPRWQR